MWQGRWVLVALVICLAGGIGDGSDVVAAPPHQDGAWLTFGEAVRGEIDGDTFRRVYSFAALENDVISLRMARTDGDLDPFLLLTDEEGNIVAWSDDNGSGRDAAIVSKRLPQEGRYFVIATRFGQALGSTTGEYELLLERVGTDGTQTTLLQYGNNVVGRITSDRPLVFYFLQAERGDVINISMQRTSGDLDPLVDLTTVDGIVLRSNDDDPQSENTLDARIANYTVLEPGIYLVLATRFGYEAGTSEGSYVLTVDRIPEEDLGATLETARLMDYGVTVAGALDADVPQRYYYFTGERGDVITVSMAAQAGNLDPFVRVEDVNEFGMAQDDNTGQNRNARIVAFSLPATGRYYIVATHSLDQDENIDGEFTLQLTGRPGIVGDQALEIIYNSTVSGMIDDQNSSEEYIFLGQEGDVIRVSMERVSGDLDALITLLDGDRKQIVFDDDSGGFDQNALIEGFELPADDMYILVASRYEREDGTTSGAYTLNVELVDSGR
ncbi:MAG: hypothetical protein GYB65_01975 [Chloroflexi bacterium]|nr:hypothetical protein [Chloroflexota bacterium]